MRILHHGNPKFAEQMKRIEVRKKMKQQLNVLVPEERRSRQSCPLAGPPAVAPRFHDSIVRMSRLCQWEDERGRSTSLRR
jgi:hypothetical protein